MAKTRVLVVHSNLDVLSKIYLSLVHRNFKAEACNNTEEFSERLKRVKPSVVIVDLTTWRRYHQKIKLPAIIIIEKNQENEVSEDPETIVLKEPLQFDTLIQKLQQLII